MNFSRAFIVRPVMTILIMFAALILGIFGFSQMAVSNLPNVNYPTITVSVLFPGANPQTMANTVATPLEKQFMTIPGVKNVTSSNTLGVTNIIVEFDINIDIDLAAVDIQAAITQARPFLPPNLPQEPTFKKVNPSASPIIYIAVTSPTMTLAELYDYANTFIGQRISIIEGVSEVVVYGSPYAVRAQVDPGYLASIGLTQSEVAEALKKANQYQSLGLFDGSYISSLIYDNGGVYNAESFDSLIVAYKNGSPIVLKNIADVKDSLQEDRSIRRYINGNIDQPSVVIAIQRQKDANAIEVSKAVKNLIQKLKPQIPRAMETIIVFDRSDWIVNSIHEVEKTLLLAFVFVVLVIFLYLGKVWDTIIPSIVMPLSIIFTLGIIYPMGFTIDIISLLAIMLAIGFIIDDAVVVLENIVRHIEAGETPFEASLNGSREIGFTILSMTLSLVAVFLPLLFMAGFIGKLFKEFAITLTVVTIISGIISLTLTPMLCSRLLPTRLKLHSGKFANYSQSFQEWMLNYYKIGLTWVLQHRITALVVGTISVFLSLLLFYILPVDFIPNEDIGFIIAYTEAEQGASSEQMDVYHREILKILKKEPEIEAIISMASNPNYHQGLIFMKMIPIDKRRDINEIIEEYDKKLNQMAGVNVYLKALPIIDLNIGIQIRGNFEYLMQSLDTKELYAAAENLFKKMRDDPMFVGISTDLEIKTPQTNLNIQRDLASTLGIDVENYENSLFLGYSTNRISRIQTAINQYDVILELLRNMQRSDTSLNDIYLRSNTTNQLVPLRAITNVTEGVGPSSINHFDQFPSVTLSFNLAPNVPLSHGIDRLNELAASSFNPRVYGDVRGAAETFQQAIKSIKWLLVITILAIYIILGILYESFVHPLTILSTLPPAIVGGLLTLFITGTPLSLFAFLGIIVLIGIVKKNGIMMVDFALDNIRVKKESPEKAIFDACIVRFRPIMMTTFAAIMGAVPIAFAFGAGAESRRPLGYVIIGGMVVSQILTLFLTPVVFLYFEKFRENVKAKVKKKFIGLNDRTG